VTLALRGALQFLRILVRKRERESALYDLAADDDDEPPTLCGRLLDLIGAPLTWAMAYSIPDCREESRRSLYFATFTMSIVWIGILSFLMVDFADRA
jgi:hypothetical protein